MRATGLGRHPLTGCIEAEEDWWKEQNEVMPDCICFRDAPLEHEDQMRIMFDAISVINETSYVPSSGCAVGELDGPAGGDDKGDGEKQVPVTPNVRPNLRKRAATYSPKEKKKTFRDLCMKRLVDAYEKKAESSNNSATSIAVDSVRQEICSMLKQVKQDGAEEGSDEHCYATQLLIKKENRDVFITFESENGRLNWLRRA